MLKIKKQRHMVGTLGGITLERAAVFPRRTEHKVLKFFIVHESVGGKMAPLRTDSSAIVIVSSMQHRDGALNGAR